MPKICCALLFLLTAGAVSERSTEVARYGCESDLGRREVTLFGNGTVRLRDGVRGEELMGLAELDPGELEAYLNRFKQEDLSEVGRLPEGVEGAWVEQCMLTLSLPGGTTQVFRFGRYDSLPLSLSRVLRIMEDLTAEVEDLKGTEQLPVGYKPKPMDILKRQDGQLFRVLGFTSDKRGLELEGIDQPLTLYVLVEELRREFVAVVGKKP
ncbi:MAG TPA: hypothetical protein VMW27_05125 [Thermoanaerobaculia bacterium]|nr:hypothetical protein [Thermoanaerobaculia bacterium]